MARNSDDRTLLLLVLVAVGALMLFPALFMGFGMMGVGGMMGGTWGGHMWDGGSTMGWAPLFGLAMQFLFLLVLLAGAYLVYRAVAGDGEAGGDDAAIEELRSAYARGELSDEEYEARREALERDRNG